MMVGGNETVLTIILELVVKFYSAIVFFEPWTALPARPKEWERACSLRS